MTFVSNSINNHRFQIEMTFRHGNITEMHLFIDNLYSKAQKEDFILLTEK